MDVRVGLYRKLSAKELMLLTVLLEKILESPLDCKEFQPINPKGNQPWIFTGRADAKALILWPPNAKGWLIRKDPDAGKDWRQEEKGIIEHEMVGWYHWFNGHEFEQVPRDGKGQGRLTCCSPWGSKSKTQLSDWTITTMNDVIQYLSLFDLLHLVW